jgi:hypothetical protein
MGVTASGGGLRLGIRRGCESRFDWLKTVDDRWKGHAETKPSVTPVTGGQAMAMSAEEVVTSTMTAMASERVGLMSHVDAIEISEPMVVLDPRVLRVWTIN